MTSTTTGILVKVLIGGTTFVLITMAAASIFVKILMRWTAIRLTDTVALFVICIWMIAWWVLTLALTSAIVIVLPHITFLDVTALTFTSSLIKVLIVRASNQVVMATAATGFCVKILIRGTFIWFTDALASGCIIVIGSIARYCLWRAFTATCLCIENLIVWAIWFGIRTITLAGITAKVNSFRACQNSWTSTLAKVIVEFLSIWTAIWSLTTFTPTCVPVEAVLWPTLFVITVLWMFSTCDLNFNQYY